MMDKLEARRLRKIEDELYRRSAERMGDGKVSPQASVNRTADDDGAYIECIVWVSREEMEFQRSLEWAQTVAPVEVTAPEVEPPTFPSVQTVEAEPTASPILDDNDIPF